MILNFKSTLWHVLIVGVATCTWNRGYAQEVVPIVGTGSSFGASANARSNSNFCYDCVLDDDVNSAWQFTATREGLSGNARLSMSAFESFAPANITSITSRFDVGIDAFAPEGIAVGGNGVFQIQVHDESGEFSTIEEDSLEFTGDSISAEFVYDATLDSLDLRRITGIRLFLEFESFAGVPTIVSDEYFAQVSTSIYFLEATGYIVPEPRSWLLLGFACVVGLRQGRRHSVA
jgi:hypothetical protein